MSNVRHLSIVNTNCALRRNVKVQPYGRCSVCSLHLPQCHAWQSSVLSFGMVMLMLVPVVVSDPWAVRTAIGLALALLVAQGTANHKRTDELIHGQHELQNASARLREQNAQIVAARDGLEAEVLARTSSLREANVALARANLELEQAAREREAMLLDVSHDLRTPLTSVNGAAQNLLDGIAGALGTSQREYVEIIRDHAQRLVAAVGVLLERARTAPARVALDAVSVDVADLVSDVARSLQPIAVEREVRMAVRTPEKKAIALADPDKLRKVIENLLGNALKFTDRGGSIDVDVDGDTADVHFRVRDTGVGMNPEDCARVFDRFYRGEGEGGGAGLGLAIARDLVRLHRGDIQVQSQRGVGSEFSVSLPRVPA